MYNKQSPPRIIHHSSQTLATQRSSTKHLTIAEVLKFRAIQSQTLTFLSQQRFIIPLINLFDPVAHSVVVDTC